MSGKLKRSTDALTETEVALADSASTSLESVDLTSNGLSAKKQKRSSSKRVSRTDSAGLKSSSDAVQKAGVSSLGDAAELDGVLRNARRTVAHLNISGFDSKNNSLVASSSFSGSRSSSSSAVSESSTASTSSSGGRREVPSFKLPSSIEVSPSTDSEPSKNSPSPRKSDSPALRPVKMKLNKARSVSASSRTLRPSLDYDKASLSPNSKRRVKKTKQLSPKDKPEQTTVEQARRRLNNASSRPVLLKSLSFHSLTPSKDASQPSLFKEAAASVPRHSSVDSPADDSGMTDPFVVFGVRKSLLRTKSVPYLKSWEVGELEVDLWLPTIGFVYDYLYRRVWRRKKKKKNSSDVTTLEDTVLAVPQSARRPSTEHSTTEVESVVLQDDGEEKIVMAGTLRRLLTLLADQNVSDKDYIDIFLSTHLHFISSDELLNFLIQHFKDPADATDAAIKTLIQVRVVNVLKKWVRYHPYEFHTKEMEKLLFDFISHMESLGPKESQLAAILKDSWTKKDTQNAEVFEFDEDPPKSILPKKKEDTPLSFLDFDPTEIARQLSLEHYRMFAAIRNPHLVLAAKEDKDPSNPVNIVSQFSDRITRWCMTEILTAGSVKKRAQVLQNMIKLCQRLVDMKNFHGAMDVFLAVGHFLIARLKRSWKAVDRNASSTWKQLVDLFNPSGGWRNLRKTIHQVSPPVIIPPAIWLHDLLSIAENDPYWDEGQKMINFEKMRLFSAVFKNVYRCQVEPYNFSEVEPILSFLSKTANVSTSEDLETLTDSLLSEEAKKAAAPRGASMSAVPSGTAPSAPVAASSSSSAPASPTSDKPGTLKRRSSLADFLGRFKISK